MTGIFTYAQQSSRTAQHLMVATRLEVLLSHVVQDTLAGDLESERGVSTAHPVHAAGDADARVRLHRRRRRGRRCGSARMTDGGGRAGADSIATISRTRP